MPGRPRPTPDELIAVAAACARPDGDGRMLTATPEVHRLVAGQAPTGVGAIR